MTENEQIVKLLDMVKDSLATLAIQVYQAQQDGKVDWMEGLTLASTATTSSMMILTAFKGLSEASTKSLIEALQNSDLVIRPMPF